MQTKILPSWRRILLAGAAGGLAEVLWVSFYMSATQQPLAPVAREITLSLLRHAPGGSVALGLAIHFLLSFVVATAFVVTLYRVLMQRAGGIGVLAGAVAALALIWATNFFVVLPVVNPHFVALMPLAVTLASKALFGVALGAVLAWRPVHLHTPMLWTPF